MSDRAFIWTMRLAYFASMALMYFWSPVSSEASVRKLSLFVLFMGAAL